MRTPEPARTRAFFLWKSLEQRFTTLLRFIVLSVGGGCRRMPSDQTRFCWQNAKPSRGHTELSQCCTRYFNRRLTESLSKRYRIRAIPSVSSMEASPSNGFAWMGRTKMRLQASFAELCTISCPIAQ